MSNNITAKEVQDKLAAYEKTNDPFDLGVQKFIKDAGIPKESAAAVTASVDATLIEFEKYAEGLEKQVGAFIDSVEVQLEKSGATSDQVAQAWISILQRMGK